MNRDREAIAVRASELFSDEFCSAFDWPDEQSDAFFEKVGLMVGSAVERAFDDLAGGGVEEALAKFASMSAESGGGKYQIVLRFSSMPDLHAAQSALAALSPTTLGGRSGSAQDGLPPARSLPSALTSAGPATGADQ